jgi:hypothetical protein
MAEYSNAYAKHEAAESPKLERKEHKVGRELSKSGKRGKPERSWGRKR